MHILYIQKYGFGGGGDRYKKSGEYVFEYYAVVPRVQYSNSREPECRYYLLVCIVHCKYLNDSKNNYQPHIMHYAYLRSIGTKHCDNAN